MNHDPSQHFTDEQLDIVTEIFHGEINKMLVKIVGANLMVVCLGVMAVGAGWYRLGKVEEMVATVPFGIDRQHQTDVANLQRQIDAISSRFDRVETKIDLILNRI